MLVSEVHFLQIILFGADVMEFWIEVKVELQNPKQLFLVVNIA